MPGILRGHTNACRDRPPKYQPQLQGCERPCVGGNLIYLLLGGLQHWQLLVLCQLQRFQMRQFIFPFIDYWNHQIHISVKYLFLKLQFLNPSKLVTANGPAVTAAGCPSLGRKHSAPVWCAEFIIREVDVWKDNLSYISDAKIPETASVLFQKNTTFFKTLLGKGWVMKESSKN